MFGCPFYIFPEVLTKHYDPEADISSAGVMVYVLLWLSSVLGGKLDDHLPSCLLQMELQNRDGNSQTRGHHHEVVKMRDRPEKKERDSKLSRQTLRKIESNVKFLCTGVVSGIDTIY
ncbi:hypothetical protein YC2023_065459 [Brassica napus]